MLSGMKASGCYFSLEMEYQIMLEFLLVLWDNGTYKKKIYDWF